MPKGENPKSDNSEGENTDGKDAEGRNDASGDIARRNIASRNIDAILRDWPYQVGEIVVRQIKGEDGRDLLQMRLEMGLLQLEFDGRPDGQKPEGYDTYFDYLKSLALGEQEPLVLNEHQCAEIDREFVQFYHRRICWLTLREFHRATRDADHSLELMDFSRQHSPDKEWTLLHEQYRPFVLFHRTQAAALAVSEDEDPSKAIAEIDTGLERMRELFAEHDAVEQYEENELVVRLTELRESMRDHYKIEPPLTDQLADAIAAEEYELAARLRDEISQRDMPGI